MQTLQALDQKLNIADAAALQLHIYPASPLALVYRELFVETLASGGKFFDTLTDSRLKQIYENLGSRLGTRKETRQIGDFFAGGSAAFMLFGGALSALWFRRVP